MRYAESSRREPARPESTRRPVILPVPVPVWKRVLDFAIAATVVVLVMPVICPVVALFIKLVSPRGPVFFRQPRVGFGGALFTCLKFRTMHPGQNEQHHGDHMARLILGGVPMQKLDDHANIIPLGRILRKCCVDELPQIFNILRGEMSVVGPRPCTPYERDLYLRWHHQRFDVLPGMTGLWQVSGKNRLTFMEMMRLDAAYTQRLSLWRDVRIICKTPATIVRQAWEAAKKRKDRQAHRDCVVAPVVATMDDESGR